MRGVGEKDRLTMLEYVLSIALFPIITILLVFGMVCFSIMQVIGIANKEEDDDFEDWEDNY